MQVQFAVQYLNGRPVAYSVVPVTGGGIRFVELTYSQILETLSSPLVSTHLDPVTKVYFLCVFARREF